MALSACEILSSGVCPWLRAPLRRLESARQLGRLGHGWLLTGPVGIGKINLALAAARRLLEGTEEDIRVLSAGDVITAMKERHEPADRHPDLHWLFPDAKRNTLTVEQVREASRALSLTSLAGQSKVLILEPADAMTPAAANALLKTLEEPSADSYLFLVAHQPGRLPATIRSRCQTLRVRRPPLAETAAWLKGAELDSEPVDWTRLLEAMQRSPFRSISHDPLLLLNNFNRLNSNIHNISTNQVDPQTIADEWMKGDLESTLTWFVSRLQTVIRIRLAPESVADQASNAEELESALMPFSTRFLFELVRNAELLLGHLGGGINVDLAVRSLLLELQPEEQHG